MEVEEEAAMSPAPPSTPPTKPSPRVSITAPTSPRKPQYSYISRGASAPRTARVILSPNLKGSPYLGKPFNSSRFIYETQMTRRSMPLYIPNMDVPKSPPENRSPRKYLIQPHPAPVLYPKRARDINHITKVFEHEMIDHYTKKFENSTYTTNMNKVMDESKVRTAKWFVQKEEEGKQIRRVENREVKAAITESYKHDIFHGDEYYSKHFKSLRIIPGTERYESQL